MPGMAKALMALRVGKCTGRMSVPGSIHEICERISWPVSAGTSGNRSSRAGRSHRLLRRDAESRILADDEKDGLADIRRGRIIWSKF